MVSEKQKPPVVLTISLTVYLGLSLSYAPNASHGGDPLGSGLWRSHRRFGVKESPTGGVSLTVWKEDAFGRESVEVEERRGKGMGRVRIQKKSQERHLCPELEAENEKWPRGEAAQVVCF